MPELPEIETVSKLMRKVLVGHEIESAEVFEDTIVFKKDSPGEIEKALVGRTCVSVGRKGKYFWLCFGDDLSLIGHLGMSGWVEKVEEAGEIPRFCKLILSVGKQGIAFTDARRLGRIWLAGDPLADPTIQKLGFDAYKELPKNPKFAEMIQKRKAPIKAVLLDQGLFSGIGNYLADEILYHAKIAPQRVGADLSNKECSKLRSSIEDIVGIAVDADADENRFPTTWLFHHRWGGKRGATKIGSHEIVRDTVGGRTTAWVPSVQK